MFRRERSRQYTSVGWLITDGYKAYRSHPRKQRCLAHLIRKAIAVVKALQNVKQAWQNINKTMNRMPEGCDPYIYYHRVRPYIHGWKNNQALPQGLIYEGVEAYGGKPQQFRGETGAQSAIVPTMDALFNIC